MSRLVIQLLPEATEGPCALCGEWISRKGGPQLALADRSDLVCSSCGKKEAPSLAALLDLEQAAGRVGRIGRHSVFPPLASLLDLARAAENYLDAAPPRRKQPV
jgi:hypothetical protein